MDAAQKMDHQYRYQRHVYDWSRRYYLLGRNRVVDEIKLLPGQCLLEVGCGTGTNLFRLARCYPNAKLCGVDASNAMLETAKANPVYRRYTQNIHLRQGLAQQVGPKDFGQQQGFDHILMSYVLSMIPDWQTAVEQAVDNLKPGGCLHVVDFSDQRGFPAWFQKVLSKWLEWFHVHPDAELTAYLEDLAKKRGGRLEVHQVFGRYALIIHYQKKGQPDDSKPKSLQISQHLDF